MVTQEYFEELKESMAIRKELIDHQCLRAVISMPAGVFQPYSGVSTAICNFARSAFTI